MPEDLFLFGQYLKWGIECVAAHQPGWKSGRRKKMTKQDAMAILGERCGRGPDAVERWARGHLPPDFKMVEDLAQACVEMGGMHRSWLHDFLNYAGHPSVEATVDLILIDGGSSVTRFLDDNEVPRVEIFDQLRRYVMAAQRKVRVLNTHLREPSLDMMRAEMRDGGLANRIAAAEKLLGQHTYYDEIVGRAEQLRDRNFEYVRLVQVSSGVITPENTGYHYLRHFYRMLVMAEPDQPETYAGQPAIQVLLLQGIPVRNTTFILIDEHTLCLQITGVRADGSYELRGVQIIQDERPNGDPTRWGKLFDRLQQGAEGHVVNVCRADLEVFEEVRRPLGELIAPELIDLIRDMVADCSHSNRPLQPSLAPLLSRIVAQEDVESALPEIIQPLVQDRSTATALREIFVKSAGHSDLADWWNRHVEAISIP